MVHPTIVGNVRYQHPEFKPFRPKIVSEFTRGTIPSDSRVLLAAGAASLIEYAVLDPRVARIGVVASDPAYRDQVARNAELFSDPYALMRRLEDIKRPKGMRQPLWRTEKLALVARVHELAARRHDAPPTYYESLDDLDASSYDIALLASEWRPEQALARFERLSTQIPTELLYHVTDGFGLEGVPLIDDPNYARASADPRAPRTNALIGPNLFAQLMRPYVAK